MRPVSMLGQKICGTKDNEMKIVNGSSKITRTPEIEIVNQKNFIEIRDYEQ